MKDVNPTDTSPSFEAALEQLQQTVKRMESGELSLEQALQHFENGVKLTRLCQDRLATAEQRVELLMKSGDSADGKVELQPFTPPTR
ncbi:MAG TPA: exodeoxyribonuclease VII small subunit [Bdellovibrionota bacterium]|jgi:exodeoxyribonuclease VII small subunit|nr:exodeoxyribonuclease VII small subunit [Bdellovibrionota bacterium]